MSNKTGTTTSSVNLRQGAGTGFPVLATLTTGTSVTVKGSQGKWLKVEAGGREGFVHADFVHFQGDEVPAGFLIHRPEVAAWPLTPDHRLSAAPGKAKEIAIAGLWNRCGGPIERAATLLHVEPAVAMAVALVESGGTGFENGQMIIRFENHHFWKFWGKQHSDMFNSHFQFDQDEPWKGHLFRDDASTPWKKFHGDQTAEWRVFEKAAGFDRNAAQLSISMGLPQIMGSNYSMIGYDSVEAMFSAFSKNEREQLIGFFDFIQGAGRSSRMVTALQRKDFLTFASLYNGGGQAPIYAERIEDHYEVAAAMLT